MYLNKLSYQKVKSKYLKFLKSQEVLSEPFRDKISQLNNFYQPISEMIYKNYIKNKKTQDIGLSGGQGSGKSTISSILKILLKESFNLETVIFSIDDFYKTLKERKKLSNNLHKLFLTRGVPGTHDTHLLNKTLNKLTKKKFKPIKIPCFDKSKDDRFPYSKWKIIKKKPQIIIFEGWCVGAKAQSLKILKRPVNILEKKYDSKTIWRKKVNSELKKNYLNIFKRINQIIFLKVPNFQSVFNWRLLQEQKLRLTSKSKKTMSFKQIKYFIMYYERITKQMINDLTKKANIVLYLDKKHRLSRMKFN